MIEFQILVFKGDLMGLFDRFKSSNNDTILGIKFNIPDGYSFKDEKKHSESYGTIISHTYEGGMYDIVISVSEFNSVNLAKQFLNHKFGLDENPHIVPNIYNGRKGYTNFSVFTAEFSYLDNNKVITINAKKELIEEIVPK